MRAFYWYLIYKYKSFGWLGAISYFNFVNEKVAVISLSVGTGCAIFLIPHVNPFYTTQSHMPLGWNDLNHYNFSTHLPFGQTQERLTLIVCII